MIKVTFRAHPLQVHSYFNLERERERQRKAVVSALVRKSVENSEYMKRGMVFFLERDAEDDR